MTNLSKQTRELLIEHYVVGLVDFTNVQASSDGTKIPVPTTDKRFIEAAYIPEDGRPPCVCRPRWAANGLFVLHDRQAGLPVQLTAGEIVNQIVSLPERDKLTNIVYMGMGEPFDNLEGVMQSLGNTHC